jgi:hypothetical protein
MIKPLAIALSGMGRGWQGENAGSDLINVQCKAIRNCHNKSAL